MLPTSSVMFSVNSCLPCLMICLVTPSTDRYKINAPPGIGHSCLTLIQFNCAEIIADDNEEPDMTDDKKGKDAAEKPRKSGVPVVTGGQDPSALTKRNKVKEVGSALNLVLSH